MTVVPITIYAEMTPNPDVMKYVANKLLNTGTPLDFTKTGDASNSPLAKKLLHFPFVDSVFIANNYVSVTKSNLVEWNDVTLELREFIRNFIMEGGVVIAQMVQRDEAQEVAADVVKEEYNVATTEIDKKIISALDEYIRPAVESDGGSIDFKKFEAGKVHVVLRGACSGCPSSTVTLKHGIESLLKRMVPEVQEVVSESM
jgi:NFU1 iron-sulfur cluster scaffold homolog, mitochondrial